MQACDCCVLYYDMMHGDLECIHGRFPVLGSIGVELEFENTGLRDHLRILDKGMYRNVTGRFTTQP